MEERSRGLPMQGTANHYSASSENLTILFRTTRCFLAKAGSSATAPTTGANGQLVLFNVRRFIILAERSRTAAVAFADFSNSSGDRLPLTDNIASATVLVMKLGPI